MSVDWRGKLPVFRGIHLDADDLLRREVITQLICHFELCMPRLAEQLAIDLPGYFFAGLRELQVMVADGLVSIAGDLIRVLPAGRLLICNVCMVFDRYLRDSRTQRFSKII